MLRSFRARLQEKKVATLVDTYDTWQAEHRGAMRILDMEDAIATCREFAQEIIEKNWQETWSEIQRGERFSNVESIGRTFVRLFEELERILERAKADAHALASQTGQSLQGMEDLDADLERVRNLHKKVLNGWPWEDRPWPPLNRAMQERSRTGQDGPGEPVENILARLQSGGSLISE